MARVSPFSVQSQQQPPSATRTPMSFTSAGEPRSSPALALHINRHNSARTSAPPIPSTFTAPQPIKKRRLVMNGSSGHDENDYGQHMAPPDPEHSASTSRVTPSPSYSTRGQPQHDGHTMFHMTLRITPQRARYLSGGGTKHKVNVQYGERVLPQSFAIADIMNESYTDHFTLPAPMANKSSSHSSKSSHSSSRRSTSSVRVQQGCDTSQQKLVGAI